MIRDCRFHGRISKNGREYSDKSMWQIKKLYETVDISFDHGSTGFRQLVGKPENLRMTAEDGTELREGGTGKPWEIRGDAKVILNKDSDEYGTLMNCADAAPGLIKYSHEIPSGQFRVRKRRKGLPLVEEVTGVRRIALITGVGGVNNSLYENEAEPMDEIREASDVKKEYPLVYDQIINVEKEGILETCGCKSEGGALEKVVSLETKLVEKDKALTELQEKLDVFEDADKIIVRKQTILDRAKELKHVCSDEILETLLNFPDTEDGNKHIDRLLKTQPELKEDGGEGDPKPKNKPTQEGSITKGDKVRKLPRTAKRLAAGYVSN